MPESTLSKFEDDEPKVFVVDDDPAFRRALERVLETAGLSAVMYESAKSFLDAYKPNTAGCLLLDLRLSGMSGVDLQALLVERGVGMPIIIITGHADVPTAVKTMGLGAFEFFEKPFDGDELIECIHKAIRCDAENREKIRAHSNLEDLFERLTRREREVLELIVAGNPNRSAADILGVTTKTIEAHRAHIMQKLEVNNIAALISMVFTYRVHLQSKTLPPQRPNNGQDQLPPASGPNSEHN